MTGNIKKRHPLVAALLSAVCLGLGQLYNGQLPRAFVFFTFQILIGVAIYQFSPLFLSMNGLIFTYASAPIILAIWIYAVFDAYIVARKIGEMELRIYNRWYVYLFVFALPLVIPAPTKAATAAYWMASGSMMPTVLAGDYVIVDKDAFRDRAPERGDVVVFKLPSDNKTDYVSRIVGLSGDEIQVRQGILHINGNPVTRDRIDDFLIPGAKRDSQRFARFLETLPNGRRHHILEVSDDNSADNTRYFNVPANHYFAMGDNRDRARDSRFAQVGYIPRQNLIGIAKIIHYSFDTSAAWWQIWLWPDAIRVSRIGNEID